LILCAVPLATSLVAQSAASRSGPVDSRSLSALSWRNIGPFRGGRISAVSGVIGQPGVFYAGTPQGGVWKTTSAGEMWYPIFDSIKSTSSIGAVEVAPSDPNVIYVGTGDLNSFFDGVGDGMYKSSDAGRTWRHIGLDATQQISSILVSPRDPKVILVGALGNPQAQTEARGVFRSTDGGATWTKTLYVDDETGIAKLARAEDAPDVVFVATMFQYLPPGISKPPTPDTARTRTRLYKSTDGGVTWREISGGGLGRLGRLGGLEESRHLRHVQRDPVQVGRRGQYVHRIQGWPAGRRRSAGHVDRPHRRQANADGLRPGRDRLIRRRRHLELVV